MAPRSDVIFNDTGYETVILAGKLEPSSIEVLGGNYTFTGNGYFDCGYLSANGDLTLENTSSEGKNSAGSTSIESGRTLTVKSPFLVGYIENRGTLCIDHVNSIDILTGGSIIVYNTARLRLRPLKILTKRLSKGECSSSTERLKQRSPVIIQ